MSTTIYPKTPEDIAPDLSKMAESIAQRKERSESVATEKLDKIIDLLNQVLGRLPVADPKK